MTHTEALAKSEEHKNVIGKSISREGDKTLVKINRIIVAPTDLGLFTKYYRDFIENNIATINAMPHNDYDVYFYNNPYGACKEFCVIG